MDTFSLDTPAVWTPWHTSRSSQRWVGWVGGWVFLDPLEENTFETSLSRIDGGESGKSEKPAEGMVYMVTGFGN